MNSKPIRELMSEEYLAHYNHNHDARGRFASSAGSSIASAGGAVKASVKKLASGDISLKKKKASTPVKKLSRKQKSKEETSKKVSEEKTARKRKEAASKVISSGDAKAVLENRDSLTTAQLKSAIDRINTEMTLQALMAKQNPTKLEKVGKIVNAENIQKLSNMVDASTALYNNAARIANLTRPDNDQLKYIGKAENKKSSDTAVSVEDILKDNRKYNDTQVKEAVARARNLESLQKYQNAQVSSASEKGDKKGLFGKTIKKASKKTSKKEVIKESPDREISFDVQVEDEKKRKDK